jgi:predicted enzyme related to lactoylglutathione lyase
MSGRVVHFELPHDDGDRARDFYQKVFGWNMMPMPEMTYTMVSTGPTGDQGPSEPGYIGGGLMEREEPFQGPVVTVEVDDIDSALAKIEQSGGKTVRPGMEVGEMGFAAYFTDTEGNLMGLWQNAPQTG